MDKKSKRRCLVYSRQRTVASNFILLGAVVISLVALKIPGIMDDKGMILGIIFCIYMTFRLGFRSLRKIKIDDGRLEVKYTLTADVIELKTISRVYEKVLMTSYTGGGIFIVVEQKDGQSTRIKSRQLNDEVKKVLLSLK